MACPYDDQQVFEPSGAAKERIEEHMKNDKASPIFNTTLVYLQGCEALHGPSNLIDKATVEEQRAIKECIANVLKRAVDDSKAATPVERKQKSPPGPKDAQLTVLEKITNEIMFEALNSMEWPYCFSRGNVRPEDMAFIEAAPVGLVRPYFMRVCLSRFTKSNPNMTKMSSKRSQRMRPSFSTLRCSLVCGLLW